MVKQALSPDAQIFKRFLFSAILFVLGMIAVCYANIVMPSSLKQEVLALLGLLIAVPSAPFAFYYYVRFLLTRIEQFKQR